MARKELHVSVANAGPLIVNTGFKGYDVCLNSFVGCEFGCKYCYVRFTTKDVSHAWGDFVRVRKHLEDKLPKELQKGYFRLPVCKRPKIDENGKPVMRKIKEGETPKQVKETVYRNIKVEDTRLVLGTATDPYQPQERKHRITRTALQILLRHKPQLNKVGIFTRSPIILDDLDLIVQLPRKRVHYTVTPYAPEILHRIEPIAIRTDRRWDTIRKLKAAGVRIHVNVSPALPVVSERFTEEFVATMADIGVDQWYVDPMQAYSESWEALKVSMVGHPDWSAIEHIMSDRERYLDWKATYRQQWKEAWDKVQHKSPNTLPIWCDHISGQWVDLRTGEEMDHKRYGDDVEPNNEETCDNEEGCEE